MIVDAHQDHVFGLHGSPCAEVESEVISNAEGLYSISVNICFHLGTGGSRPVARKSPPQGVSGFGGEGEQETVKDLGGPTARSVRVRGMRDEERGLLERSDDHMGQLGDGLIVNDAFCDRLAYHLV